LAQRVLRSDVVANVSRENRADIADSSHDIPRAWSSQRMKTVNVTLTVASRVTLVSLVLVVAGCSSSSSEAPASSTAERATVLSKTEEEPLPPVSSPYDALPAEARGILDRPFTGDADEMVKRRLIRAGVVYNRTQYFIDHGVQRGISYEALRLFEDELNKRLKTGLLKVHVAIMPIARDQLFPALVAGKVDLIAAALTITPERRKLVDFSNPTRMAVSEIVVTSPEVTGLASIEDLSGREVFVRRSSSYYESLERLNESLTSKGKAPVTIKEAPEALEDDDILEMVNAGLMEITVVDDFVAEFWQQVFPNVRLHTDLAARTGGEIAVGVRKNSPRLLRAVNTWIKEYGPRTAFGNTMERRYLENTKYIKNAAAEAERRKLRGLVKLFQTYGGKYDVDYLLMAAQGYQESQLDQSAKSSVGAIGVMQVMPATGKDLAVGDITQVEPNIHAGVKYFRFMMDEFYKDEPMDDINKGLMTLASYNAGPGRMRQLRRETEKRGLNPNVWFGNVERVVSERIGRETVTYVSNIYKYYIAYRLTMEREAARDRAKDEVKSN
jgi:membrane-bound lytic murein transglycosylase MltF